MRRVECAPRSGGQHAERQRRGDRVLRVDLNVEEQHLVRVMLRLRLRLWLGLGLGLGGIGPGLGPGLDVAEQHHVRVEGMDE